MSGDHHRLQLLWEVGEGVQGIPGRGRRATVWTLGQKRQHSAQGEDIVQIAPNPAHLALLRPGTRQRQEHRNALRARERLRSRPATKHLQHRQLGHHLQEGVRFRGPLLAERGLHVVQEGGGGEGIPGEGKGQGQACLALCDGGR